MSDLATPNLLITGAKKLGQNVVPFYFISAYIIMSCYICKRPNNSIVYTCTYPGKSTVHIRVITGNPIVRSGNSKVHIRRDTLNPMVCSQVSLYFIYMYLQVIISSYIAWN